MTTKLKINKEALEAYLTKMLAGLEFGPHDTEQVCIFAAPGVQLHLVATSYEEDFLQGQREGLVTVETGDRL